MLFLTRSRTRTVVSGVAAATLAATALAFAGSPAQAADGATPAVTPSVSFDDGIDITVAGSNFNPTSRPGAMGVYVAVAEKQDILGLPAEEVEGAFFAQAWVTTGEFTDGSFTRDIEVDPADVEAGKDYAVYTWTAHGNPTAGDSQYTETDVQLTQAAEVAAPAVTVTAQSNGAYVDFAIAGSNFDPASRPGAMGVYVGLAEKQDITKVDGEDQASGMEAFVGSDWVMPGQFSDGTFTKSLTVKKSKLTKGTDYAIYTWTAHGNPTAGDTQLTETVVKVPGLPKNASKLALKVRKKPTSKKKGKAKVSVKGVTGVKVTGKVKVALKKGKRTKRVNATLNKRGKVTLRLPKLTKGKWKIVAKYKGNKNYKVARKSVRVKIRK